MELYEKECVPCKGGVLPFGEKELEGYMPLIDKNWNLVNNHHIERKWDFDNFQKALDFVNVVGGICEDTGHHANFEFGWGFVTVLIWTHKIDGLTESDFILASIIDRSFMG